MEVQNLHQLHDVGKISPEKRRNSDDQGHSLNEKQEFLSSEPLSKDSYISESKSDNELLEFLRSKFVNVQEMINNNEFDSISKYTPIKKSEEFSQFKRSSKGGDIMRENSKPKSINKHESIMSYYIDTLIDGAKPFCKNLRNNFCYKWREYEDFKSNKKMENKDSGEDLKLKIKDMEGLIKKLQHNLMTSENEYNKDKGLLDQK